MRLALVSLLLALAEAQLNETDFNDWPHGNVTQQNLNMTISSEEVMVESSGESEVEDHQHHQSMPINSHFDLPDRKTEADLQILKSEESLVDLITHKPTVLLMRDDVELEEITTTVVKSVVNQTATVTTPVPTAIQRNATQTGLAVGFYSFLRDRVLATGLIAGLISIALVAIFSLAVLALCQNYRKQHYGEWMVNGNHNYTHEIDPQFFENGGFMYDNCPISGVVERRLVLTGDQPELKLPSSTDGYDNGALELDNSDVAQGRQIGRWFVPLRTLELMERIKTETETFEMTEKEEKTDVILED